MLFILLSPNQALSILQLLEEQSRWMIVSDVSSGDYRP